MQVKSRVHNGTLYVLLIGELDEHSANYTRITLDDEEDGLMLVDRYNVDENDDFVDKFALKDLIENLEERDKKIILMRYFYDKTQSEIAERLGVSQVQVSRLENKILENLRKKLTE